MMNWRPVLRSTIVAVQLDHEPDGPVGCAGVGIPPQRISILPTFSELVVVPVTVTLAPSKRPETAASGAGAVIVSVGGSGADTVTVIVLVVGLPALSVARAVIVCGPVPLI